MRHIYCTTFCNFGHDVESGEPIDHECYVLPPEALEAEMEGDFEKALEIMNPWRSKRRKKRRG